MKRNSKILSAMILFLSLIFVMQFEGLATRVINDGYRLSSQTQFNLNNRFEYRAQIVTMETAYVIVDPTELIYISASGDPLWKKDIASQNVGASMGSKWMVLCENKAGDLFVLNQNGDIIAEHLGLGPIEEIKVLENTYIGILMKSGELILMSSKLELISATTLPKGSIIDYGLNNTHTDIVVTLLDLSRKSFNTKLVFLNLNGDIKSGSHIYESIAYHTALMSDKIVMVVDEGLLFYNYMGEIEKQITIDRTIQNFLFHDDEQAIYMHLIHGLSDLENPNPRSEMVVYTYGGEVVRTFEPPIDEILGMNAFGSNLLIYGKNEIAVLSSEGKVLFYERISDEIRAVHNIKDESYAIETINRLDVYIKK